MASPIIITNGGGSTQNVKILFFRPVLLKEVIALFGKIMVSGSLKEIMLSTNESIKMKLTIRLPYRLFP